MKKRFEPIAVETDDSGNILIIQDYGVSDPITISIRPEQIPLLVSLLREAEAEGEGREDIPD
jgi:hypothetical protein